MLTVVPFQIPFMACVTSALSTMQIGSVNRDCSGPAVVINITPQCQLQASTSISVMSEYTQNISIHAHLQTNQQCVNHMYEVIMQHII